jgi:hypothetical protein
MVTTSRPPANPSKGPSDARNHSSATHMSFETDPAMVARELSGLTFARVRTGNAMTLIRAAHWHNLLDGLGLGLPFFLVHDLGNLLSVPSQRLDLGPREQSLKLAFERGVLKRDPVLERLLATYQSMLVELARAELCQRSSANNLADELLVAVLAKMVEPVQSAIVKKGGNRKLPLTAQSFERLEPAQQLDATTIQDVRATLQILVDARVRIRICLEQIDLDTIKLLELLKGDAVMGGEGATELLDLYRTLATPLANDIANFSLDLIPSILETKKSSGVQTYSIDGYASIETRGSLDSLLPSELAYDDELFDRRYADNELFYYGRERQDSSRERLNYILVDASASMRGLRTVFARGLALALAKKMTLKGEQVWLRFFDSRLYERQELTAARLRIPYLLCFKAERGRNTTRVFTDLDKELSRLQRESPKEVMLTFITHGRSQVDLKLVESIREKANVTGVFVTTQAGELRLDYLHSLHHHHVITPDTLSDRGARKGEALKILGAAKPASGPRRTAQQAG